jgi:hypothetical protein
MDPVQSYIEDIAPNAEWRDAVLLAMILATALVGTVAMVLVAVALDFFTSEILVPGRSYPVATYLVASIAAVSAWVAIYELRHPDGPTPPDVRQDFRTNDDGECLDFGLRNYGAGPALYIQFVAQVDGEDSVCLGPLDRPIHLNEGEFVGLVNDDRPDRNLFENKDGKRVKLYCAYVSVEGVRGPRKLDVPDDDPEKDVLDELTEYHPMPQGMPMDTIRAELDISE